jgi:hypothetical protein
MEEARENKGEYKVGVERVTVVNSFLAFRKSEENSSFSFLS